MTDNEIGAAEATIHDHARRAIDLMKRGAHMTLKGIEGDASFLSSHFGPEVTAELGKLLEAALACQAQSGETVETPAPSSHVRTVAELPMTADAEERLAALQARLAEAEANAVALGIASPSPELKLLCPTCAGKGKVLFDGDAYEDCPTCKGDRFVSSAPAPQPKVTAEEAWSLFDSRRFLHGHRETMRDSFTTALNDIFATPSTPNSGETR